MHTQHTVGVDLASAAEKTALAILRWTAGRATLIDLRLGVTDADLLAIEADAIGIDAPFGWPSAFCAVLAGTRSPEPWTTPWRDALRFRATDHAVRALCGRWPLSVSTDLIGVPALRCHGLLTRMGVVDRSGDGRVFEVYPAAALQRWDLPTSSYKKRETGPREALIAALKTRAPWLDWGGFEAVAVRSHDALDAVVAALNTRAAAVGLTLRPPADALAAARSEGWIAVPEVGSLARLPTGPAQSRKNR